jgi:pilus assembly protein CpaB
MRAVFGLVFVVGLALAGFAVYMVQGYVGQNQAELRKQRAFLDKLGPVVEVYVVTKPLAYGVPLTKEDVKKVLVPKNSMPEGIFTEEAVLFPDDYSDPRFVKRPLETMEPILASKVTEPGENAGLTSQLSKGMRAFAIEVDVASGVSGFLQPGDLVDVYWTGSVSNADGTTSNFTRLIEGSIRIVAVDQTASNDSGLSAMVARTVTVEATPEEVARLAQAQATGRLALSLVGMNETVTAGTIEVDTQGLLGIEEQVVQEVAAPAPERVCTIRTRKGADTVEVPIPCTN